MRGATRALEPTGAWPTIIGLVILWIAVLANQVWIFAILFVGWAVFDIVTGESHFVQQIKRSERPTLFWSITSSWTVMSILWVIYG